VIPNLKDNAISRRILSVEIVMILANVSVGGEIKAALTEWTGVANDTLTLECPGIGQGHHG